MSAAASYTCTRCGQTSHAALDVLNRYCGRCHRFEDDGEIWSILHAAEPVFGVQSGAPVVLTNVHPEATCRPPCPLHAPSEHHMIGWPLNWRGDRGFFERMCAHGVGHPDPDSAMFVLTYQDRDVYSHGCDSCCYCPPIPPSPS